MATFAMVLCAGFTPQHFPLRHMGASPRSGVATALFGNGPKLGNAKAEDAQLTDEMKGVVKPTGSLPLAPFGWKSGRPGIGVDADECLAEAEEDCPKEMSIKDLLTEYGVIALVFHFTVWITSIITVYTLLSFDFEGLPEWLSFLNAEEADADGVGSAAGFGARIATTLGIVEAVGPARLALTVTATPKVSERAREFAVVRDVEAWAERTWQNTFGDANDA